MVRSPLQSLRCTSTQHQTTKSQVAVFCFCKGETCVCVCPPCLLCHVYVSMHRTLSKCQKLEAGACENASLLLCLWCRIGDVCVGALSFIPAQTFTCPLAGRNLPRCFCGGGHGDQTPQSVHLLLFFLSLCLAPFGFGSS